MTHALLSLDRAYDIREVTSCVHCAPQDSVRVFKDVQAKKAIGMHWYAILFVASATIATAHLCTLSVSVPFIKGVSDISFYTASFMLSFSSLSCSEHGP